MGRSFTVFWAICTRRWIGSNRFISCTFTPSAAKLAQLVYIRLCCVLHSFMMMSLLSRIRVFLLRELCLIITHFASPGAASCRYFGRNLGRKILIVDDNPTIVELVK